jgi:hypothetical protein
MMKKRIAATSISAMVIAGLTAHSVLPSEGRIVPCNVATELCEQHPPRLSDDPAPRPEPQFSKDISVIQSTAVASGSTSRLNNVGMSSI